MKLDSLSSHAEYFIDRRWQRL